MTNTESQDALRLRALVPSIDDLVELNPWTIEGRYPADLSDLSAAAVVDLVARARRVVPAVDAALPAVTAE